MNKNLFPSLEKVSQEVIALGLATLAVAYIISKWPAAKALVRENSLN